MHKTMAAEQRNKHRDFTSFSIGLLEKDGEIIHCKALNLSVAGMLLDYDGACLATGSSISILTNLKELKLEIPAVVIHCNSNCIGIMFCKPQPDLYRAVTRSMRCAHLLTNSRTPVSFVA